MTYCFSSFFPPAKTTAKAMAISNTMKKPVTPQKADAILFDRKTLQKLLNVAEIPPLSHNVLLLP